MAIKVHASSGWRLAVPALFLMAACGGSDPGACGVVDNADGSATIACPDGTKATVRGETGPSGAAGQGGAAGQNGATGPSGAAGAPGAQGSSAASAAGSVIEGSYVIGNSLDVAFLAGVTRITGDLTVSAQGLTTLALPSLTEVDGDLLITDSDQLVSIALPALTRTRNVTAIFCATLAEVQLGALTSTTSLDLQALPLLATFAVPALKGRLDSLFVQQVGALTTLDTLGGLTSLGGLTIANDPALTSIQGLAGVHGDVESITIVTDPKLLSLSGLEGITRATTNGVTVEECPLLTSLSGLSGLTHVSDRLVIEDNSALTTLGLKSFAGVTGGLQIDRNDLLAVVDLPALRDVSMWFQVYDNAGLKPCLVDALQAELTTPVPYVWVHDNLGAGTCP